ncbi:MAG: twin-arginine translocase TatA/TatE family subunit [Acidimicrobiaceae bacterium]|nr:twin-arginine translocase TatA/TatE family subunit [Acidimicrobiaceae bacterium]
MPGGPEIWIIIALAVVLFGGSRLPKIARNLGRAQGELKKGLSEGNAELNKEVKPEGNTPPQA